MDENESVLFGSIALSPQRFKEDRFWESCLNGNALQVAKVIVDGVRPRDDDIGRAVLAVKEWAGNRQQ